MSRIALAVISTAVLGTAPAFTDPPGDGAPDITSVRIATSAATVTFTIATADAASWDGAVAFLQIDTTGDQRADVTYTLHSEHGLVTRDTAAGPLDTAAAATLEGATLVYRVPVAEVGPRATIGFAVSTSGPESGDQAPDGGGMWQARLRASVVRFTPPRPVHGRRFAVSGGSACVARLAGARLAGACRWSIPAGARGKALVVSLLVDGTRKTYRLRIG